jgi:tRNA A22 N-methylase
MLPRYVIATMNAQRQIRTATETEKNVVNVAGIGGDSIREIIGHLTRSNGV